MLACPLLLFLLLPLTHAADLLSVFGEDEPSLEGLMLEKLQEIDV